MSKQQSTQQEPAHTKETVEQKLDRIAESLSRLDQRDRARTIWTTIRGIIGMIPLLAIIGGAIYLYMRGDDLFQKFTKEFTHQVQLQVQQPQILKQLEQFLR